MHARITYNNGRKPRSWAMSPDLTTEEIQHKFAESVFVIEQCLDKEDVETLEVKQGHKVLCLQRFKDGQRL